MSFSEQALIPLLPGLFSADAARGKYWIAYSGGLDSHVLLLAVHKLLNQDPSEASTDNLVALHINHGLSPNADAWQTHCQQVCAELGVAFESRRVAIDKESSESLEKLARDARYTVFSDCLHEGDSLLMGHHQNDQLETMLYRLMRGTGPKGLGAIPAQRKLAKGQLLRPLLAFSREELEVYAETSQLSWIEDESNQDIGFDRNFLRQEILPLLKQRWPNFAGNWQRSAQLCAEADQLQTVLGEQDLQTVKTDWPNRLNITALITFDALRQRNILRTWFAELETRFALPMPDFRSLERILKEVLPASLDASPLVCWSNGAAKIEVRRFANDLYALKPNAVEVSQQTLIWTVNKPLQLPAALGRLSLCKVSEQGLDFTDIETVRVAFRQGGEEVKVAGRKTRSLKKIFQDYKVPPWLRERVPLIYIGDDLVAVGDLFICEGWQTKTAENLYHFCWDRSDIHCGY